MTRRLPCINCGGEYEPSPRQWKRFRASGRAGVCSAGCFAANISRLKTKPMPLRGPCLGCGKSFESRRQAKYCGLECYLASPQWKESQRRNSEGRKKPPTSCAQCGAEIHHKKKFCGKTCYRTYMAERFDRWIANPQRLGVLQNYDEFLLQNELPCLVDGCDWVGHQLSNHMNFAHGVPAEEFKRAAGFNLKTGVVSAPYREILCAREHIHEATFGDARHDPPPRRVSNYLSREAKEHYAKARAILNERTGPHRVCKGCGATFQQKQIFGITKFCGVPCRDEWYRQKNMAGRMRRDEWARIRKRGPGGSFLPRSSDSKST